jgi:cytoskeletal protein RodZ
MSAFRRKKISGEKTVGTKLREARIKKKLTLDIVEEKTKVRTKYLKAIESDNWREFPNRVYVLGFVRRYSDFLDLDSNAILDEFKSEFDNFTKNSFSFHRQNLANQPKLVITPRLIYSIVAVAVVFAIIGYIVFDLNKFSRPPSIDITSPTQEIVSTKDIVIEGKTTDTAIVEINGQTANVEDDGKFTQRVQLNLGVNVFEIKAKTRFGKEKTRVLRVLLRDPTVQASPQPSQ